MAYYENFYLLVVIVIIDILNFFIFSKGRWYALDILKKKLGNRKFKNLSPQEFTWLFVQIKFAVYTAMAFAYWAGSNVGVGYYDVIGGLKIIIIGIIISSTFIEDLGYYILNKEKIPLIWNNVWISKYVPRTPRYLIIFLSMVGQIISIAISLHGFS